MNLLFSFDGRIGRGQFWLGYLAAILLTVVVMAILSLIVPWEQVIITGPDGQVTTIDYANEAMLPVWIVYGLLLIVTTWISIAISVKRFHDRGKSGWWYLIIFVPLIGPLWWLIELGFFRGDPGPNAYGPPAVPA